LSLSYRILSGFEKERKEISRMLTFMKGPGTVWPPALFPMGLARSLKLGWDLQRLMVGTGGADVLRERAHHRKADAELHLERPAQT